MGVSAPAPPPSSPAPCRGTLPASGVLLCPAVWWVLVRPPRSVHNYINSRGNVKSRGSREPVRGPQGAETFCGMSPRLPDKFWGPQRASGPLGKGRARKRTEFSSFLAETESCVLCEDTFPPDAPLRSPRGFFCTVLRVTSPARNVSVLTPSGLAPLGDTSNKGGRSPPCVWSLRVGFVKGRGSRNTLPLTASLVTFCAFRKSPPGGCHANRVDVGSAALRSPSLQSIRAAHHGSALIP